MFNIKEKVAKNLIGKWLKSVPLQEDEVNTALLMYEEDDKIFLLSVGLKSENDALVVSRVIHHVNLDEAI